MVIDADGPPLPGQLPQPRLRRGARLRHRARPRGPRRGRARPRLGARPGAGRRATRSTARRSPTRRSPATRRRARCVELIGRRLGVALSSFANIFDPDVIVIGGGVIAAGDLLLEPGARGAARPRAAADERDAGRGRASSGPDAGMIGAATMALLELEGGEALMAGPADRLPDADRQPRGPQPARPPGAERRRPRRLRGHPPRRAACTSGSSIPRPRLVSNHEGNEAERAVQLAQQIERGARVALVSDAGMPAISDPGYRLIRACIERDLEVEVLPGPVGGDHRAGRLRAARRPLALRGLPAAPRRRAGAGAALGRDRGRLRVAAAAARLARGARRAGARPPGGGLPRADQAPRGGRARHARRAGAAVPRRGQGRDRRRDRAGRLRRRPAPTSPSRSTRCAAWSSRAPARAPRPASSPPSPAPGPTTSTGR